MLVLSEYLQKLKYVHNNNDEDMNSGDARVGLVRSA